LTTSVVGRASVELFGRELPCPNLGPGTTIIHGFVGDQAGLHGLLQKVRDIGLPLVSVTQVASDQPDVPIAPR
jgi:hypothetical protein